MRTNKPTLEALAAGELTVEEATARLAAGKALPSQPPRAPVHHSNEHPRPDIAIVGRSGRFAGSSDLDEFWAHLAAGDDLVSTIDRWSLPPVGGPKTSRRGSFLPAIDAFDPMFFRITGLEASYMDPQQRLVLEEAYRALEDAGYASGPARGGKCGVYIGCSGGDYQDLIQGEAPGQAFWGNSTSLVPARIAYYLDLHGPAIAVDTACSSSLVAIHLACQGLWEGETEMALAGGVQVFSTPTLHLLSSAAGMLSPTGRCHTFDAKADGFVLGEGVGIIVLKRLCDALDDGDDIRGVIKGCGTNQDGATNGITAPSAASQERLEHEVYEGFGIDPGEIGMVEAHGTGTVLGDPIEFDALCRAFRRYTNGESYCALGSVKTNIGHAFAAAGVAGVIRLLLALEHRQIPPSLNFEESNPHIAIEGSPFYVNRELVDWEPSTGRKRLGAVSAFGFSGTNAHAVIEEAPESVPEPVDRPAYLIALSAETSEQLEQQVSRLSDHLQRNPGIHLGDVSFILLFGRRHLPWRLAFAARDQADALALLRDRLSGAKVPRVYVVGPEGRGSARPSLRRLGNDCAVECSQTDDPEVYLERLEVVADVFAHGYRLDLAPLFEGSRPRRIPLPTYPFARERYWVPEPSAAFSSKALLHPLVHENVSDLTSQRFRSRFLGDEPFFRDHVVASRPTLPASAYLEMAREAYSRSARTDGPVTLTDVAIVTPLVLGEDGALAEIALTAEEAGGLAFEVSAPRAGEPLTLAMGRVGDGPDRPPALDLPPIFERCTREIAPEDLYATFDSLSLRYGPSHRMIESLLSGQGEAIARLAAPAPSAGYLLAPGLLDSALQATAGLERSGAETPELPFAIERVDFFAPATGECFAYVRAQERHGALQAADVTLTDAAGEVLAVISGLVTRPVSGTQTQPATLLYAPAFEEKQPADDLPAGPGYPRRLVVLAGQADVARSAVANALPDATVISLSSAAKSVRGRAAALALGLMAKLKALAGEREKGPVLLQLVLSDAPEVLALSAMAATASAEDPTITVQVIEWGQDSPDALPRVLESQAATGEPRVRHRNGTRFVGTLERIEAGEDDPEPFIAQGVYLITGGAGGLGLVLAEHIALSAPGATVVLTSRRQPDAQAAARIERMREGGSRVVFMAADVTKAAHVRSLLAKVLSAYGRLDGAIHAAGLIRDSFIVNKDPAEVREVLAPKVAGLVNLDEATSGVGLSFFVCFSSASAYSGNPGQADYGYANAFMDAYMARRAAQGDTSERHGVSLSVAWPLWDSGGMGMDEATREALAGTGALPMPAEAGLAALRAALACGRDRVLVLYGEEARLSALAQGRTATRSAHTAERPAATLEPAPGAGRAADAGGPGTTAEVERAQRFLAAVLTDVLRLPADRIRPDAPFAGYGIDSVMVMRLTSELEKTFGPLPKTLFFEYLTLADLTGYFLASHPERMAEVTGTTRSAVAGNSLSPRPAQTAKALSSPPATSRLAARPGLRDAEGDAADIAIVGLAGRYPGAKDVESFWENLRSGVDSIREVPPERWAGARRFDGEGGVVAGTWGGFMDGADLFDPLFFHISPAEAEVTDPQERIFLECAYSTLEDAGYTPADLARTAAGAMPAAVGVYVGVMYEEYQLYGAASQERGKAIAVTGNPSSIANRVSYFLDLHGPSMAVDTMCSSSLTAIHLACDALRRGECEMALAGGVNLSLHPNKYLMLSQGRFLSSSGRCESFGVGGDGYVPGEGVGAVLLKPLAAAVSAGDHIYGVIKASAINHGGKTNGYTVPNPVAQGAVISAALERARISPGDVTYIEAHGTGTSLGDPIEIAGLMRAFSSAQGPVAIGSVKSGIGHLESAAGIAGLTKVLLQMRAGKLAPSLHAEQTNPNIDFAATPFRLNRTLTDWPRSFRGGAQVPRVAGISSFGAGGANAHLIVAEHIPAPRTRVAPARPLPFVLSAKDPQRLKEKAAALAAYLHAEGDGRPTPTDADLADIAYTLACGREAFAQRCAFLAADTADLAAKLTSLAAGEPEASMHTGNAKPEALAVLAADEDMADAIATWIAKGKTGKVLELWVSGADIDLAPLFDGTDARRIPLPTYPFARERYWVPEAEELGSPTATAATGRGPAARTNDEPEGGQPSPVHAPMAAREAATRHVAEMIAAVTRYPVDALDPDTPFDELGLDSIMIHTLSQRIEEWVGVLDTTLFFRCNNISALGRHLAEQHPEAAAAVAPIAGESVADGEAARPGSPSSLAPGSLAGGDLARGRANEGRSCGEIAVVGLAGRYPKARTLGEFWQNLYEGRDCIEEIPPDRWPLEGFFESDREAAAAKGLSYSKWGGFLDSFDCFDPMFFSMAPTEARYLDPQERLFLEVSWECIEDAGHTRASLRKNGPVGVFAGVTFNNYQLLMAEAAVANGQLSYPATSQIFSIANRVSYFLDLTGPSLTLDTACSSSLYAVHLACESIRSGESAAAIAGGVNLSLHPSKYVMLARGQFLSDDGRCHAFAEGGTGYVPGEGAGAVLLKRLDDAVRDGDRIYGIVKGTGASHGGRTNGYTVPSPEAQSSAIEAAIEQAGVDVGRINFVEGHGTGTALGDPVEVAGLTGAFRKYTNKTGFCAISSVKTNIGHGEAAAGISQLTKVLLQLKHGVLVPNVMHGSGLNPNIDFGSTPFFVQRDAAEWPRPDGSGPRLAGISSFGAGGSNAHVIIEEFVPAEDARGRDEHGPVLIVLSARNADRLRAKAEELAAFVAAERLTDADLHDVAWTLQNGREPMEERLAFVAGSIAEIPERLRTYVRGSAEEGLFIGNARRDRGALSEIGASGDELVSRWLRDGHAEDLPAAWVKGLAVDWSSLWPERTPRRVALPTYPWAKERCWIPGPGLRDASSAPAAPVAAAPAERPALPEAPADGDLLLTPRWSEAPLPHGDAAVFDAHVVYLLEPDDELSSTVSATVVGAEVHALSSDAPDVATRFAAHARALFRDIKERFTQDASRRVLLQVVLRRTREDAGLAGLAGLLRTGGMENRRFSGQLLEFEPDEQAGTIAAALVGERDRGSSGSYVRYSDGVRRAVELAEVAAPDAPAPFRDATYLITGGAGGLGLIFAEEIARTAPGSALVLTGRSALGDRQEERLASLRALGPEVRYERVDVTDAASVRGLVARIQAGPLPLAGVIHAAGVIRDNVIVRKAENEFQSVLASKVAGLVALDEATTDVPLDFFVAFSSLATLGNPGQADYAAANAFMDAYAERRDELVAEGRRHGKSLSIAWSHWRDGGMAMDPESREMMRRSTGIAPLSTEVGLRALRRSLTQPFAHVLVVEGDLDRLRGTMLSPAVPLKERAGAPRATAGADVSLLVDVVTEKLGAMISELLGVKSEDVDPDHEFSEYGFDSVTLTRFANELAKRYGIELTPVAFFEFPTLGALVGNLVAGNAGELAVSFGVEIGPATTSSASRDVGEGEPQPVRPVEPGAGETWGDGGNDRMLEPIAVIGMAGRFPQADSVDELWCRIEQGVSCVTEVPADRWDWRAYFGDPAKEPGKTDCRWGGFMRDIASFDPLFFELSPVEAAAMDPKQRLFLEEAWHALEDAGYAGGRVRGSSCGVYVGVEESEYGYLAGEAAAGNGNHNGTLAARIAYTLDLRGPNLALNAACSSGLVAVHQACQALRAGECGMAIAGGVSALVSPMMHVGLGSLGLLSHDGSCRVFDDAAEGIVLGEAVGVLVLKPLSRAMSDGDHIYGCITASGVNHGGRSNGLTAPNPSSQSELLRSVYSRYSVDPCDVGFLLAHSVGSKIGDPIEIQALRAAFRRTPGRRCALGSVKPLVGHTLAASGVVSLIAMLMAMRHGTIPGVHGLAKVNEFIDLSGTPFEIPSSNLPWPSDGRRPRVGAVSTTGMSGTNAHVVVEEHLRPETPAPQQGGKQLVVLSARTADRLDEAAVRLVRHLERVQGPPLADVAYTLQVGRDAMPARLATVVTSTEELLERLRAHLAQAGESQRVFTSAETDASGAVRRALHGETGRVVAETLWERGDLEGLARLWALGSDVDWVGLPRRGAVGVVPLPGYSFERRRCWLGAELVGEPSKTTFAAPEGRVHRREDSSVVKDVVRRLVASALGVEPRELAADASLRRFGMDSITLVSLVHRLNGEVSPRLTVESLAGAESIDDITEVVERIEGAGLPERGDGPRAAKDADGHRFPELVTLRNSTRGRPVFWIHGGVGGVEAYRALSSSVGRPFYGIQARGWDTRRKPLRGVERMAAYYAKLVTAVQPDGPFDLGGYSLGGTLAYALARLLQSSGREVRSLVMLDSLDTDAVGRLVTTDACVVLSAVNNALLAETMGDADLMRRTLIHRDELPSDLPYEEMVARAIGIARERGSKRPAARMRAMIDRQRTIQAAYAAEEYVIRPLPDPASFDALYVRNASGVFFGPFEPYFSTIAGSSARVDHTEYWAGWLEKLPGMRILDVPASCHMTILHEPDSLASVRSLCADLYGPIDPEDGRDASSRL